MFLIDAKHDETSDFWFQDIGLSAAGKMVNTDTAMKLAAFWSCALVKAQTMAQLPFNLMRREGDRGSNRATDNDLFRLIHTRPNRFQTSYQWREMGQLHLDLRGNFFNRKVFDGSGRITALIPISPDNVDIERIDDVTHRFTVKMQNGTKETLTMDEVFHVAGPTLDGPEGLNPIEFHRETVGKAIAVRDYGSEFYRNGATMPGWIEYPAQLQEEQRSKLRDSWQRAQTGINRFKTPVLDRGMQYHQLQIKHTDLQYLETLKDEDIVISQIMRVPPYKIYRMDQAKFSNVEQMEIDFVRNTLTPIAVRWEQSADSQLLDEDEGRDLFFKFKMGGLLRGDTETRGEFYAKALGSGGHEPFMTVNEIRNLEDLNPLDGSDGLPTVENSQRLNAFLEANASRCVKTLVSRAEKALSNDEILSDWAAEFLPDHAAWVCDVMQMGGATAQQYYEMLNNEIIEADDSSSLIESWKQTGAKRLMELAR